MRPVCTKCGYIFFHNPKVAVGVVAVEDGKILLVRRNVDPQRGLWSYPAGYVDEGERVEDALRREVREETNLDLRLDHLLGVYSEEASPVVFIVYTGTIAGGKAEPGPEVSEVGFFPPNALPPMAFDHDQRVLKDWASLGTRTTGIL